MKQSGFNTMTFPYMLVLMLEDIQMKYFQVIGLNHVVQFNSQQDVQT